MKPHHTDRLSLAFGIFFLGVAGLWLAAQFKDLHPAAIALLVAVGLVLVGAFGLLNTLVSSRRPDRDRPGAGLDQPGGDRPGV